MNFPKPDPGLINCVSCRHVNVVGCFECRRCAQHCGCICRDCWNCTHTVLTQAGRRWTGHPVKHHPKYFCRLCRKCLRRNSEGLIKHECQCRARPSAARQPLMEDGMDFNVLARPLGLELECSYLGTTSQLNVPKYCKYQWVHDGSITAGGQEMVLERLIGDNFLRAITALAGELDRFEFAVDKSCGFHVHVGAEDFGAYELRRLVLLYHRFEDVFYNLCAPGRDKSREYRGETKYYAKRWGLKAQWYEDLAAQKTAPEIRHYLLNWIYAGRLERYRDRETGRTFKHRVRVVDENRNKPGVQSAPYSIWPQSYREIKDHGYVTMPSIRAHKYESARYLGLNLHTWFQRGTVEYRHHEGTVELNKLLYWPLWCGWFTEVASVMTDVEVAQCYTLDQLLDSEWKRPFKVTAIPAPVKEWVRKTLEERKKK